MRRRLVVFSVLAAMLAALAVGGIGVLSASGQAERTTICHATNSDENPYQRITPANEGVLNGHFTQHNEPVIWELGLKDQGIRWGDIIPPVPTEGIPDGLNWTAEGQAIFNNDCVPPGFVPPATSTTTPEAKPAPPQAPKAPSAPAPVRAPARFTG